MQTPLCCLWVAVVLVAVAPAARSFSRGAGRAACRDMIPGHISAQPLRPRHGHVTLRTSASSYLPGQLLTVSVRSSRDFMGFLLQARGVEGGDAGGVGVGVGVEPGSSGLGPVLVGGSWTVAPPGTHTLRCLSEGDTLTHSDKQLKRNLSFVWRAPDAPGGDVRFYITVVQSYFVYWAGIESAVVHDGSRSPLSGGNITGVEEVPALPAFRVNGASNTQPSATAGLHTTTLRRPPAKTSSGAQSRPVLEEEEEEEEEEATEVRGSTTSLPDVTVKNSAGGFPVASLLFPVETTRGRKHFKDSTSPTGPETGEITLKTLPPTRHSFHTTKDRTTSQNISSQPRRTSVTRPISQMPQNQSPRSKPVLHNQTTSSSEKTFTQVQDRPSQPPSSSVLPRSTTSSLNHVLPSRSSPLQPFLQSHTSSPDWSLPNNLPDPSDHQTLSNLLQHEPENGSSAPKTNPGQTGPPRPPTTSSSLTGFIKDLDQTGPTNTSIPPTDQNPTTTPRPARRPSSSSSTRSSTPHRSSASALETTRASFTSTKTRPTTSPAPPPPPLLSPSPISAPPDSPSVSPSSSSWTPSLNSSSPLASSADSSASSSSSSTSSRSFTSWTSSSSTFPPVLSSSTISSPASSASSPSSSSPISTPTSSSSSSMAPSSFSSSSRSSTPPHPEPSPALRRALHHPFTPSSSSSSSSPPQKLTPGQRSLIQSHITSSEPEPRPNLDPTSKLSSGPGSRPNPPPGAAGSKPSGPSGAPDEEGRRPAGGVPGRRAWELGALLGCSAGLGAALVVGFRLVYRQAGGRQTEVRLHDREREHGRGERGLIHVQECGDLVRVRRIRENSFVLLAEYDILASPGD